MRLLTLALRAENNKKTRQRGINGFKTRITYKVLILFFLLVFLSGCYLGLVTILEGILTTQIETIAYQYMFLLHLLVGVGLFLVFVIYVIAHFGHVKKFYTSSRVKTAGIYLSTITVVVCLTGLLVTRGIPGIEINESMFRAVLYFFHVGFCFLLPLYFLKHRGMSIQELLSPKLLKLIGLLITVGAILLGLINQQENKPMVVQDFSPSLLKAKIQVGSDSQFLDKSNYCQKCHNDIYRQWEASSHRFSSFNNPFYKLSVDNSRNIFQARDGHMQESRFCAGCHDIYPLITGEFDNPDFDHVGYPSGSTGITCSVCHTISQVNSLKGNGDFTLEEPVHYPFAFHDSKILRTISDVLIKSNPDFHRQTFLKPVHKTPEFCSGCHKVHLSESLNQYKWLRGQNHYDSFMQSGVSGHSIDSFNYPAVAKSSCQSCHMNKIKSSDLGTRFDPEQLYHVGSNHFFPAANTAVSSIFGYGEKTREHQAFLKDSLSVHIVGLRENGRTDGKFLERSTLNDIEIEKGEPYLAEVVIRSQKVGHEFTNGTADSNQIWLQITLTRKDDVIAGSGMLDQHNFVDPEAHFIHSYVVDRRGDQIKLRNVEDIYTVIYNHQIPPGSSDVVHYEFLIPDGDINDYMLSAELKYRKFDNNYLAKSFTESDPGELPITTIAFDAIDFSKPSHPEISDKEITRRLNDYGIAQLRKRDKSHFKQAESIFKKVANKGEEQGVLNLLRLYYQDGQLERARMLLKNIQVEKLDNPWTVEWYSALLNTDYGNLDEALISLLRLYNTEWESAQKRGFDFSYDLRLVNKIAEIYFLQSRISNNEDQNGLIELAKIFYHKAVEIDPENLTAHFGLFKIAQVQNDQSLEEYHYDQYATYKPDENALSSVSKLARIKNKYLDQKTSPASIYKLK